MAEKKHILVVDDEPSIRLTLETGLSLKGFRVSSAATGREAFSILQKQDFDAVLCDVLMPDGDGLALVKTVREFDDELPLILMTAQGSVETAVKAVSEGASDFIAKPFEVASVAALLSRHVEARREKQTKTVADMENLSEEFSESGLIGRSPAMVSVYKLIAFAARTNATVLIMGESGTGKELVARAIHNFSGRSSQKFVSVNCSGLTDTLLEAELFGYEKGAFTGANSNHAGLFEAASGGTIFLDELASTSAGFQASLLRVLQSGEIRRVGATETRRVDVRIIGASNANLQKLSEAGNFRSDLYFRLSVLAIELPPLRERISDVPLLVQHFLRKISQDGQPMHLTQEVWDALSRYDFPGNVRELENALVRAVALSTGNVITLDYLPAAIIEAREKLNKSLTETETLHQILGDRPTIDELQRRYLSLILAEVGENRRRAAEKLGLDRRTIQRLIAKYNLLASAETEKPTG
ncbi:MAG TPA: sigma-54 dependent transcriptional regulator [Pyrinomonadaceae bacterium]|jgi:DNA-binding NtrC family response regulator